MKFPNYQGDLCRRYTDMGNVPLFRPRELTCINIPGTNHSLIYPGAWNKNIKRNGFMEPKMKC